MNKFLSVLMVGVLTLLFPLFFENEKVSNYDYSSKQKVNRIHANYDKNYSDIDLFEEFDYTFIGEVDSYLGVSQYNGYGMDIPYSFFTVKVKTKIKGEIPESLVIKFYGGYDNKGNLVLFDEMIYPQINKHYKFYCNKTVINFSEDGRTLDSSFVISMKYNMWEYNIMNEVDTFYRISPFPDTTIVDQSGTSNFSFDTAIGRNVDSSISTYIGMGREKFYKINNTSLKYISIFSKGDYDTVVYLYDSNRNLLASNDDVTGRGLKLTDKNNFYLNFYADLNTTYYIKVKLFSPNDDGNIVFSIITDNCYDSANINDLLNNYNSVDSHNDIDYTNESKYENEVEYGVKEWNKLGSVDFQKDTLWTNSDVTISDYYENETSAVIGYTTHYTFQESTVKFNTYFFDSMTYQQRIHTVLHEFGHLLGLKEFTGIESANNVMHQGKLNLTKLGPADIAVYRVKWG